MAPKPVPVRERFWSKVAKTPGCWEWTAAKTRNGRAVIRNDDRHMVSAARLSWAWANGKPFPRELFACHTCDNPSCVNPDHIFPGTNRDNQLDAIAKGRNPRSAKTHCKRGHEFTEANTYHWTNGVHTKRLCRACARVYQNRRYHEGWRYPRRSTG